MGASTWPAPDRSRELSDSHCRRPLPSVTPTTTSSSDSPVSRVRAWGNISADIGCPLASMAIEAPVKIWWLFPAFNRSPRIRLAASLWAEMFPDSSNSTMPSLSEATTAS